MRRFSVGFCLKPPNAKRMPYLAPHRRFFAPKRVDCRDYMTPTECQGDTPMCAAYAAANWAEAMIWMNKDYYEQIPAKWIYDYAKGVDGLGGADGTTLTAALEALRGTVFDRDMCKVKVVRACQESVRYAIHKFGAIVAGFDISDAWYGCTKDNPVISDHDGRLIGGHAVVICGYDKDVVYFQNSWGAEFGEYGFGKVDWPTFDRQFVYGAVLSNVLDGMTINT